MIDYSGRQKNAFDGLRFSQVRVLLDILNEPVSGSQERIKRAFQEQAERFEDTLTFAVRVGLVEDSSAQLSICTEWPKLDVALQQATVLHHVFRTSNRYRSDALRFVGKFRVVADKLVYFSSTQSRSSESSVRNFLMELNIVQHERGTEKYVLAPEYVSLYAVAKDILGNKAPSSLVRDLAAKCELGVRAEAMVLAYERGRIGARLAHKIHHVSQCNVSAGYDIRSITIADEGRIAPRFIEVKAVSGGSFRFHWSENEVAVARSLAHWYYLYLLPVDGNGSFDIAKLEVIADPYKVVLGEGSCWTCEPGVLRCYRGTGTS